MSSEQIIDGRRWVNLDHAPLRFAISDFADCVVHDNGGAKRLWDATRNGTTVIGHSHSTMWVDAYDYAIEHRANGYVLHLHPCADGDT